MNLVFRAIALVAICVGLQGCGEQNTGSTKPNSNLSSQAIQKLLQDISGVWNAGRDGLVTLNYRDSLFQMLLGDVLIPVKLGDVDPVQETVNLTATAADGKDVIWTIRKVWDTNKQSFHLNLTLHDGTHQELGFVRKITSDDLNRIANMFAEARRSTNPMALSDAAKEVKAQDSQKQQSESTSAPSNVQVTQKVTTSDWAITDKEAEVFVNQYIAAMNSATSVNDVLPLYAPEVDYFKKGVVSKAYIEEDKARYFKRWPKRALIVQGVYTYSPASNGVDKNVSFMHEYSVSNDQRVLNGKAAVFLTLSKKEGRLFIVKEGEDVFRN